MSNKFQNKKVKFRLAANFMLFGEYLAPSKLAFKLICEFSNDKNLPALSHLNVANFVDWLENRGIKCEYSLTSKIQLAFDKMIGQSHREFIPKLPDFIVFDSEQDYLAFQLKTGLTND